MISETPSTYVLVHGAGHGGWCFRKVSRLLQAEGHTVYSPTQTGLGDRAHLLGPDIDMDTHITDVVNLLFYEDLTNVILVGHSYGGTVCKGVVDRAGDRVGKLVFLDAPDGDSQIEAFPPLLAERANGQVVDGVELVLFPREELLELFGFTDRDDIEWTLPRLTPHPWKSLEQKLVLKNRAALDAMPQFQVVARSSLGLGVHSEEMLAKAREEGRYWEIEGGHDLMITEPDAVAAALSEIADATSDDGAENQAAARTSAAS